MKKSTQVTFTGRHEYHGETLFLPLPAVAQRSIEHGCDCPYCKRTGNPPMWDTLAVAPKTGETWVVHYPEIARH